MIGVTLFLFTFVFLFPFPFPVSFDHLAKKKIGDDITHCVYHVHYSVHNFYNLYFSLYLSPYLLLYYKDTHIIVYVQYYISIMLYSLYDKGCHLASFICVVKIIYTCIYTTCNKDLLLTQSVTNEYL